MKNFIALAALALHQVKGLPEQILEGRQHLEQEWFFRYLLKDESAIDARSTPPPTPAARRSARATPGTQREFGLRAIANISKGVGDHQVSAGEVRGR